MKTKKKFEDFDDLRSYVGEDIRVFEYENFFIVKIEK